MGGGKSELHRAGWSVTQTVSEPLLRGIGGKESATESIPPAPLIAGSFGSEGIPSAGKGEKGR